MNTERTKGLRAEGWFIVVCFFCFLVGSFQATANETKVEEVYPKLLAGCNPKLCPRGEIIAAISIENLLKPRLCIMDTKGERRHYLKVNNGISISVDAVPAWSPDGQKIAIPAFLAKNERVKRKRLPYFYDISAIFLVNRNLQEQKRITQEEHFVDYESLNWSPKGDKLAFVAQKWGVSKKLVSVKFPVIKGDQVEHVEKKERVPFDAIWIIDTERGAEKQLTVEANCDDSEPCFSPDGAKIAFTRSAESVRAEETKTARRSFDIWVMDLERSKELKVTSDGLSSAPRWSPDGSKIAYYRSEYLGQLWLMNPDGSDKEQLVGGIKNPPDAPVRLGSFVWHPDSKRILFISRGNMYIVDIETKKVQKLTKEARITPGFSISFDKNLIVYSRDGFVYCIPFQL